MDLGNSTYICLDIPEPYYSRVREIREAHCNRLDTFPIEMTIAGSSGVGAIKSHHEWNDVQAKLVEFSRTWPPIVTQFAGVVRFPGTDIFVLSMQDPAPFQTIHEALQRTGFEFDDSRFPFFPHVSLRMSGELSEADINDLFSLRIAGEFAMDTLSLYQMRRVGDEDKIVRVWEHRLEGSS
jgi:2'-5' RNA ligase